MKLIANNKILTGIHVYETAHVHTCVGRMQPKYNDIVLRYEFMSSDGPELTSYLFITRNIQSILSSRHG
jgi:hypothetical protein